MPKNVVAAIQADMEGISSKIRDFENRAKTVLITTPINASGFVLGKIIEDPHDYSKILNVESLRSEAMAALKGKPMTAEEWQQVVSYIEDLHKAGFYHGDLFHNLFFRRDDNGKLIISLLDFEKGAIFADDAAGIAADMEDLSVMKEYLETIGALEKDGNSVTEDEVGQQGRDDRPRHRPLLSGRRRADRHPHVFAHRSRDIRRRAPPEPEIPESSADEGLRVGSARL